MRTRSAAAIAFALCLSAAIESARAEEAPVTYPQCDRAPTEGEIAGAKGAFHAGQASFEEADYARAIEYWLDAYRRDCTAHALLINLARAYELNGDKAAALGALDTYLTRVPGTPDRARLEKRAEVLRRQIEAERATSAPAPAKPESAASSAPKAVTQEDPGPATAEPTTTQGRRPLLPLIVAGAGGALAIVGGVLYIPARMDLNDAEERCPNHQCVETGPNKTLSTQANNARTRVDVSTGVIIGGAVLLGGGLAWYFLSPPSSPKKTSRTQLLPVLAPTYAGLTYDGTF